MYLKRMVEMTRHTAGRVYLIALLLSVVGFIALMAVGVTTTPAGAGPILVLGWMTMPLVVGIGFVLYWLVAYVIYFFFFWPYR